ncbi:MAG: ATP synthase F1 subunit delta [Candidatus Omnitrophota bacterium]|nr:ATP synthase F1 subunit delta [Candidatus Omnitrophota bacterium]MBU1929845.1 ATP synthase F1 subunit delta [Candidatus Omnitrophota bacterium]MBU2034678.1 ATP synthase F1 subunit delta [Candidatus Omnitrophota bacterium]MBU2222196.1 ATP synthase F1 subunit delta [Candidatus Omnitrophota bacterium]
MKNKPVAKRYAESFLEFIRPSIGMASALRELKDLKLILHDNPDFEKFLDNPDIAYNEKIGIIDRTLEDFSGEIRDFLKLLLEKGRIGCIIDICDYARVNYSKGEGIDVLLKTTYPLDLSLIRKIKEKLEDKFKKRLVFHLELDADLLGGIQVTVGNTLIDGSVRKRLNDLRKKLMAVRVN